MESDSPEGEAVKSLTPLLEEVYTVWVRRTTRSGYEPLANSFITGSSETEALEKFFRESGHALNIGSLEVRKEWRVKGWQE